MPRDIFTVIEKMIEFVPKDDFSSHPFLDALNKHLENMVFIPPELMYDFSLYNKVVKTLVEHFGESPPTEGWKKDVYDVWMDKK